MIGRRSLPTSSGCPGRPFWWEHLDPSDLVGVPIVFRATEVFAAAAETLAHVPRRGLMTRLARHALLLIVSHWTALPPAQAPRQAGPEWRQRGSSQTPGPRLGCRGASPSIRRRGGHQTPPDLAASAYESRRRSDLARAPRRSRDAVVPPPPRPSLNQPDPLVAAATRQAVSRSRVAARSSRPRRPAACALTSRRGSRGHAGPA